jgi:predicted O-methyltransferase YrrM
MTIRAEMERRLTPSFSLNEDVLRLTLKEAKPFGHNEDAANLNLGFGFIYYGVVRAVRPKHVLVIGSGYGFSVVCLALALKDNGRGTLTFVDPSYSLVKHGPFKTIGGRGTWDDPSGVQKHWRRFGVEGIVTHYRLTSEELFGAYEEKGLAKIDLAFIDGSHTYKDVKNDFISVVKNARKGSYVFLHDTNIYFRELLRHAGVKRWINVVGAAKDAFQIVDFPYSSGVALVRVVDPEAWEQLT